MPSTSPFKKTDYSTIAGKYDTTRRQFTIAPDAALQEFMREHPQPEYRVLDVGCGTGNYLEAQARHLAGSPIRWTGIDPSPDMLAKAREKVPAVEIVLAPAEALPFPDGTFDAVISTYAFHHFTDKEKGLDEIRRVLKSDGFVRIENLDPYHMRESLLYQAFEGTYAEDEKRFWPPQRIFDALTARRFTVKMNVIVKWKQDAMSKTIHFFRNRDISQLALLSDEAFEAGMQRLEQLAKENKPVANVIARIHVLATKNSHAEPLSHKV